MSDDKILKSIAELQTKMDNVTDSIINIRQKISAIELDSKRSLKANVPIPPGIGCKFAYDGNGLILKTLGLSPSDIPQLEVDSIKGLRELLSDKLSKNEYEKLQIQASNSSIKKSDKIFGTGCKINYDENGFVVSSTDLSKNDIPIIELEGVNGLVEKLQIIETVIKSNHEDTDTFSINPDTGCKVSYDSKGRVIKSENLSMDDIPREIINKVNEVESKMVNFADQRSVTELTQSILKKLDANTTITPGTFTKLTVDSNGLVTKGDRLSKEDLPVFNINDIIGLESVIKNKADKTEITTLSNSIESISSFINKVGDIVAIRTAVDSKAESSEVESLKLTINSLRTLVNDMASNLPYDSINNCIRNLEKEISSLAGRISVIEKKLNINI